MKTMESPVRSRLPILNTSDFSITKEAKKTITRISRLTDQNITIVWALKLRKPTKPEMTWTEKKENAWNKSQRWTYMKKKGYEREKKGS